MIQRNRVETGEFAHYDKSFSYLMPSRIRNNILRNNEKAAIKILADAGQPMIVEDNNIEGGYRGKGNFDKDPGIAEDGSRGHIVSARFDPVRYTTVIRIEKPAAKDRLTAGRVIHIGKRWSVINEAQESQITLWGDLSPDADSSREFEIIPSYRPR